MMTNNWNREARQLQALVFEETKLSVEVRPDLTGRLPSLEIWFSDFAYREGPVFVIHADGLHRHRIEVWFGLESSPVIRQMNVASLEQKQIAAGFLGLIVEHGFDVVNQDLFEASDSVSPNSQGFVAVKSKIEAHTTFEAFKQSVVQALIPLCSAIAELIGYEDGGESRFDDHEMEGAVKVALVRKRERSFRNRQLCLAHHGAICFVCGFEPKCKYGDAGNIIEVHHVQPLSSLSEERAFDPIKDLIPLCPNCHRAIHSMASLPLDPEYLKTLIKD